MLRLSVAIALLTNVELDHHATFASLAQLREAFGAFLALAREAVVIWDRPELLRARRRHALVASSWPSTRLLRACARTASALTGAGSRLRLRCWARTTR